MLHISIKAEPLFSIFGFPITNSILTAFLSLFFFAGIFIYYDSQFKLDPTKRSSFFYLLHYINKTLYGFFRSVVGKEHIDYFYVILSGFFIYILLENWLGLLPGVGSILVKVHEEGKTVMLPLLRGNDADLNTTLALATISVLLLQYYGVKFLGFREYFSRFFNFSSPINFFTGVLEIISEISKVISFSFRLFGNIFAGEVVIMIVAFLIPILASFPFLLLEIFVGFIQALVFAMLTAVFVSIAISHEE